MEPETGYAVLDGQQIAYQVIGDGPVDVVVAPAWFSAFDTEWQEPQIRRWLERLGSFARIIRFDRRGSGASDPLPTESLPPWEAFAEDIACVLDAVGVEQAFVWADGDAGPIALLFAATHPERVRGLILFGTSARFLADEDYEFGIPEAYIDELIDQMVQDWGTGEFVAEMVPSRANDREFVSWMARLMRATATPSAVAKYMEASTKADVREVLPTITQPTLILQPKDFPVFGVDHARYLDANLANSTLVELDGPADAYPSFGLADQVTRETQRFLTGAAPVTPTERALATVLFTDIVSSTEMATQLGDRQWRRLLDRHDDTVRRDLSTHSGYLVKNTGDGILATFDGPGRAVGFARALNMNLSSIGLSIRTGIHTGEIEQRNGDIGGLAVHLGARIMAAAAAGEILVSRTVKDLVIGSSLQFVDRGVHALKGIDGEWQLYAVA
ncbi:MAG: adenylate/guanylate cyclase domain-containing protein [Acidimicrobiia bacterium]|nr:adenylate/guanylate cyclase domain-containing protein [Acidimicrobiia bacterium]